MECCACRQGGEECPCIRKVGKTISREEEGILPLDQPIRKSSLCLHHATIHQPSTFSD